MKQRNCLKLLSCMFLVVIFVFSAFSCGKKQEETSKESKSEFSEELLCDFESEREMLKVAYRSYDGKIQICDDKNYVTSGEKCAKFTFMRDVSTPRIAFLPGTQYFRKLDFTDTVAVELDVFNASDEDLEIYFSLGIGKFETIKTGKNHLVFPVERKLADVSAPNDISIYIRGVKTESDAKQAVLYMDKMVAIVEKDSITYEQADFSEGYTFDSESMVYNAFAIMGSSENLFNNPRYSMNRDPKYILNGTGSMRVEMFSKNDGSAVSGLGFRTVKGSNDLKWNEYSYDSAYLTCDLYNDNEVDINTTLQVFTANNKSIAVSFKVKANSWSDPAESRLLLRKIMDLDFTMQLDIMTIVIQLSDIPATGGVVYLDNISIKTV